MARKGESREELIKRLNEDLENFVADCVKKNKDKEPEPEMEFDEILKYVEGHPAFMNEIDLSKPLSSDVEGLMRLKYEEEDPTAKAEAYKEDGNHEFKKKKYDIAIENYTVGITANSPDRDINAILYSNRAAAQYHIGNYRSALRDCVLARRFKGDHMKAIVRGAMCCHAIKRYPEAGQWCDAALWIEPTHEQMLKLKQDAEKRKKEQEKERRKEEAKERKEKAEELKLIHAIESQGIKLAGLKLSEKDKKLDPLLLTNLELHNPSGAKVHIGDNGLLLWPVLLIYPEHAQTDYIEAFNESHRFADHINHMFSPDLEPPNWDRDRKYTADRLRVYFEDKEKEVLYQFSQDTSLLKALQHKRYVVEAGTPSFLVIVDKSPFQDHFLKRYSKVYSTDT